MAKPPTLTTTAGISVADNQNALSVLNAVFNVAQFWTAAPPISRPR